MLRNWEKKALGVLSLFGLALGFVIATSLELGNSSVNKNSTLYVTTSSKDLEQRFGFGELILTVYAVSKSEIALNMTFINYEINRSEWLAIWIGINPIDRDVVNPSLEGIGFQLLSGNLQWNGSAETKMLSIEGKIKAIKDGKYFIAAAVGRFETPFKTPFKSTAIIGSGGVVVYISNGMVTDITASKKSTGPCCG